MAAEQFEQLQGGIIPATLQTNICWSVEVAVVAMSAGGTKMPSGHFRRKTQVENTVKQTELSAINKTFVEMKY
jgi:hypothetical protein